MKQGWSFPNLWTKPLSLSVNCWRGGVPIEGEQGGESQALRGLKGPVFPACELGRVTSKVLKRKDEGFR